MNNNTIISDIHYHAVEDRGVKNSLRRELGLKSVRTVDELKPLLNHEGKVLLDKLLDQWGDMEVATSDEQFELGFRLGVKLMCEVFERENKRS
ncbi:MAG: hypothetical protein R3Y07_10035 [Eubacteriales bacterium]